MTLGQLYANELESEIKATRHCLERVPLDKYDWKPHEKSMILGYLAVLVAEIPMWISEMIEKGEIDYATFKHPEPKTNEELVQYFDGVCATAKAALEGAGDERFAGEFILKAYGKELMRDGMQHSIMSTLNHWVHHRGQLTVYLRLLDIPVPSIYGPSADDKSF